MVQAEDVGGQANFNARASWSEGWCHVHYLIRRADRITNRETLQLAEPQHEIITLSAEQSDAEVAQSVKDAIAKMGAGRYGAKVLLKLEDPRDLQ